MLNLHQNWNYYYNPYFFNLQNPQSMGQLYMINQFPEYNVYVLIPQPSFYNPGYFLPQQLIPPNPYFPTSNPPMIPPYYGYPNLFPIKSKERRYTKNDEYDEYDEPDKKKRHNRKTHKNHRKHNTNHNQEPVKNPPQPPPEIPSYCTYAATRQTGIRQRFYHCETCGIVGENILCEICAKNCHKNHDIILDPDSAFLSGFCDCQEQTGHCNCMPKNDELKCVSEITCGKPSKTPVYQCRDCGIAGDSFICQNCAIKLHNGHDLMVFFDNTNEICYYYKKSHQLEI